MPKNLHQFHSLLQNLSPSLSFFDGYNLSGLFSPLPGAYQSGTLRDISFTQTLQVFIGLAVNALPYGMQNYSKNNK
jgi:hypothetical protein